MEIIILTPEQVSAYFAIPRSETVLEHNFWVAIFAERKLKPLEFGNTPRYIGRRTFEYKYRDVLRTEPAAKVELDSLRDILTTFISESKKIEEMQIDTRVGCMLQLKEVKILRIQVSKLLFELNSK